MKLKNLLMGVTALGLAMSSCSSDSNGPVIGGENGAALRFHSSIGAEKHTKMLDNTWQAGDAIGIYMLETGGALNSITDAQNKQFTTTGSKEFTAATAADELKFPLGQNVDFVSYYPYSAALTADVYAVDVADQSDFSKIDLLYSNNSTNNDGSSSMVNLTFKHHLSKVILNVTAGGDGIDDLTGLAISLKGFNTKADFKLADATLENKKDVADLTLTVDVDGTDVKKAVSEAIVIPGTLDGNGQIVFALGGKTYAWTIPATTDFELGKQRTYNVTIKGPELTATVVNPEGNIEDWGAGGTESIQPGEIVGQGTQASPFTVSDINVIGAGAKQQWVKGYAIGSTSTLKSLTPNAKNLLLAEKADETDETKCLVVDLEGNEELQKLLNLVDNPELIGTEIHIQADIVNDIFGGVLALTNLMATNVEGGGGEEPEVPGGEPKQYFFETFGREKGKVNTHTGYDEKSVKYSSSSKVDIRITGPFGGQAAIWMPNTALDHFFMIEEIDGNYKDIKMSYQMSGGINDNAQSILVTCNGVSVELPSIIIDSQDSSVIDVEVSIPDGTTEIKFVPNSEMSRAFGTRITNIKLVGTPK